MSNINRTSVTDLRFLLNRVGLDLSDQEIESLRPIYDFYAAGAAVLQELDLGTEDLAITFSPDWETRCPVLNDFE